MIELNRAAFAQLRCEKQLVIVPGATHLFEEPGALDEVARLAREWFERHLAPVEPNRESSGSYEDEAELRRALRPRQETGQRGQQWFVDERDAWSEHRPDGIHRQNTVSKWYFGGCDDKVGRGAEMAAYRVSVTGILTSRPPFVECLP